MDGPHVVNMPNRVLQLGQHVYCDNNHSDSEESKPAPDGTGSEDEHDLHARTEALRMLNNLAPKVIDNLLPEIDDKEEPIPSLIEHVKMAQAFIEKIKKATYDNGKLDPSVIEWLQNPTEEIVDVSDPDLQFSLDLYMSCMNTSEATYNSVQKSINQRFPETKILSQYLAKKLVSDISGVICINDDMCINSCHAFTGPLQIWMLVLSALNLGTLKSLQDVIEKWYLERSPLHYH